MAKTRKTFIFAGGRGASETQINELRQYIDDSLAGAGAVAGKPCQIQSITAITGGHRVVFLWEDNSGVSHTSSMDVMDGKDGTDGTNGTNGKSAYEIAVANGYSGTQAEWLASLKGDKGDTGATGATGEKGDNGTDGYTPYIDSDTGRWFINGVDTGVRAVGGATSWADIINPPTIPTAVSELSNDKNFIDNTVDNLVNYLKKTDTYTKDEITDLMKNISAGLKTEIVENLPDVSSADSSTIYLIKATDTSYTQYMLISGAFANLGSTEIDLSGYVTTTSLENKLQGYSETSHTHTELHTHDNKGVLDGITAEKIANWDNHFSGDYNDLTNTPSLSGYATKTELEAKQDTLTNAETVGKLSESDGKLLFDGKTIETDITIDDELSDTSENAVQNKVVKSALDAKQDKIGSITYTEFSALSDDEKEALGKVVVTDCPDYTEKDIYSTEEKVVGQWIDGKPIYQKTIYHSKVCSINNPDENYDATTYHSIASNIEKVWLYDGFYQNNANEHFQTIPFMSRTDNDPFSFQLQISQTDGYIVFIVNQDGKYDNYTDVSAYFTFRYTKTTD